MVELCRCHKCGHWNPPSRGTCFLCKVKVDPALAAKAVAAAKKVKKKAPARKPNASKSAKSTSKSAKKFPLVPILGGVAIIAVIGVLLVMFGGGSGENGQSSGFLGPKDATAPTLDALEPEDGSLLPVGTVEIRGMANEDLESARIAGWDTIVTGNAFSADVPLEAGEVTIEVVLVDKAGNETRETANFTVFPLPEGLELAERNSEGYATFRSSTAPSLVLVKIPAGTFPMGSPDGQADELPIHDVTLSSYLIASTETTNAAYATFVAETGARKPSSPGWSGDLANYFESQPDSPVVNVNWKEAKAFCEWANLRLPTEEEWAYAARGSDGRTYPWGEESPDEGGIYRAAHKPAADGYPYVAPVGSFPAGVSPFGIHDMAGNVWEWTADGAGAYPSEPVTDPEVDSGARKILRGGSWTSSGNDIRSANRYNQAPEKRGNNIGFRCAASLN